MLALRLKEGSEAELELLRKLKLREEKSSENIQPWDRLYYLGFLLLRVLLVFTFFFF
jgi:thiosulfate reductase cytochrome b subunit